jgi:hypothetical protein
MEESYNDALEKYYSLKSDYHNEKQGHIAGIRGEKGMSVKEKRAMFSALKFKCINCKRPVGTIFSNTYDDQTEERHLRAICGDKHKPCNLLIDINVGYCELESITMVEKMIDDVKIKIIKTKNDMLFGYITEENALAKFEVFKTEINELTSILELNTLFYVNNTLNKSRLDGMLKYQADVYVMIDEFKKLIKNYTESANTQFVKTAVTRYIHELKPLLKVLREQKYSNSRVEYDEKVNENSYLIQEVNSLINIETCYGDIGVVSYVTKFTGVQPNIDTEPKFPKEPEVPKEKQVKEPKEKKVKEPKVPKEKKVKEPKVPKVPKEKKVKEPKVPKEKKVKEPKVPKEKKVKEPKVLKEKKAKQLGGNLDYETDVESGNEDTEEEDSSSDEDDDTEEEDSSSDEDDDTEEEDSSSDEE